MAEIENVISKQQIENVKIFTDEILKSVGALDKLAESGKKLIETNAKIATSDDNLSKKKKQLTEVEKEEARLLKETEKVKAKLSLANTKLAKSLTEEKIALKQVNDAVKESITGEKAAIEASKKAKAAIVEKNKAIKAEEAALKALEKQKKKDLSAQEAAKNKAAKKSITEKTKALKVEQSAIMSLDRQRTKALGQILKEEQETKKLSLILNQLSKGSYQAISKALSVNLQKWKLLTAAERDNSKEGKKLTATINNQRNALTKLDAKTGTATRGVGKYAQGITTAATSLIGAFGLVGGIAAFAKVLTSATGTVIKFSKANSVLASVLGKTKREIVELTKDSLEYGKTTQFTAVQVSQLQTELAKLGFKQDEIRDSTQAILDFALATDAELAPAAKVAGATLRAMGLETSEMGRVTSVLAVATTKTALSFEDYEGNLSKVLPVAKSFGFSLEDTVALFGKLRDAGFDASTAATATRNIFLNMADANGALAEALGGNVENFDDLIDGLIKMNEEGFDLNETLKLTDKRSVAAFNQFLTGAESARTLKKDITNVNDALKVMVETRTDNAASSIIKLGSAWDGIVLRFRDSEGFIKDFLDVTTETLGKIDRLLSSSAENMSKDIDIFLADTSKAAKDTVDFWKENSKGAEDFVNNLEQAIIAQSELTAAARTEDIQQDTDDSQKRFDREKAILLKLGKELEIARNAVVAEGLAKKFDIENKSIEDLKKLQKTFTSFETGEMKERGDLILPLIEEQIKQREDAEFKARQERAKADRESKKERKKNAKIAADVDKQIEKDLQKEIQDEIEDTSKFIDKTQDFNVKVVDDGVKDITKAEKKSAEERRKIAEELAMDKLALEKFVRDSTIDLTAQGVQAVTDILFESSSQRRDEELDKSEEQREEDLEIAQTEADEDQAKLDEDIENGLISESAAAAEQERIDQTLADRQNQINEEASKRDSEIKTRQAKAEKLAAIASIAVDTAVQLFKIKALAAFHAAALNPSGVAIALAQIPFVIAGAAIQTAAVLATPIPKFFKGAKNTPSQFIAGDSPGGGLSEMIIKRNGDAFMTPDSPTMYSNMQGAEVVPNSQVKERLAEMSSKGQGFNFSDSNMVNELKGIKKAVNSQSRSSQIDDIVLTKRGGRMRKQHKSFLNSMGR